MNSSLDADALSSVLIAVMGVVIFCLLYFIQSRNKADRSAENSAEESAANVNDKKSRDSKQQSVGNGSGRPKAAKAVRKDAKHQFSHQWLACTLKGHTGNVLDMDFSPNGKYMISCDDDRSCFVWLTKDWAVRKSVSSMKVPLQVDHACRVAFSPDSKAFLLALYNSRKIAVYKLGKCTDADGGKKGIGLAASELYEFEHQPAADPAELVSLGMASNGQFIMTCYSDTQIRLWSRKGDLLAAIDTCHMSNCMAAVSPCGRFVASCGFTPDVKVWEICFDKAGCFQAPPSRVFELKGHNAQVDALAFSANSTRMATVSKDMTWKLWNIDVRYKLGEDPRLLVTGRYARRDGPARLSLSPDARVVAIATGDGVSVYSCLDASRLAHFDAVLAGLVRGVQFDTKSQFLVTSGEDKRLPVLLNAPGAGAVLQDCRAKIRATQSRAQKEMFQQEMQDAEAFLGAHGLPMPE